MRLRRTFDAEAPGARERLERVLLLAVGLGAVVFGALLATGTHGFLGQAGQLVAPFGAVTGLVGVGLPVTLILASRILPRRGLLGYAAAISLAFVAVQFAFPLLLRSETLDADAPPWLQGITAVHATMAAVVWPRVGGWVFAIAQGPIVALTQMAVRDDAALPALLDGVGAVVFCAILCGVSIAVIQAGSRQDAAADAARAQAALEASRLTRESEQARINAIVHDDVMSVLLSAARRDAPGGLAEQARLALTSVESLASGASETRPYDASELAAVVRDTARRIAPDAEVSVTITHPTTVDADVAAAFAEATGEAVRNAMRHAEALPEVGIVIADGAVTVDIVDHGRGFTPARVGPRRLGVRVSIVDRMRRLPGGRALIASAPGRGTRVTLEWTEEP